jgi:hypothetical protein
MRILRSAFLTAALAATLASGVARAQAIPFDIEVGYRFLSVSGNDEIYRSQVNEREGFLIRSIHLATDEKYAGFPLADKVRIDGADLGAGPNGFLRLDAGLSGVYRLRFTYRNSQFYDWVNPAFVTQIAGPVTTPTQQSFDRTRNQFNVDLEVLPGKVITPLVGYTSNTLSGPGYTTYHFGEDEFRLAQDLRSHDQEFRVGAAFNAGFISGEVVQGWRKFHETENLSLSPAPGSGDNSVPVLGLPVSATSLKSTTTTDINVPVTSAFVRAFATDALQISGFYVRANTTGDSADKEAASGSFASFAISRFFTGFTGATTSTPTSLVWRAGGRAEWHVLSGLDVTAGYTHRDQTWDSQALIADMFTGTSTFTNFSQTDLQTLLTTQTSIERKEDQFDVQASARLFGPVGFRLGYSRINQDLTVVEDPAEIIVAGNQGSFTRNINRIEGALTFSMLGFNLMGEASYDDASAAITRIDYLKKNRERVRLTWKGLPWITVGATGFWLDQKNEDAGPLNVYDATSHQYTADLTLNPVKWARLHGSYAKIKTDSSIPVRAPQDFTTFTSLNTESGDLIEAGAGVTVGPLALDGFWSRFNNEGTYTAGTGLYLPTDGQLFRMYRGGVRADWSATPQVGLVAEWSVDRYLDYYESGTNSYRANRIGVYLKWRP